MLRRWSSLWLSLFVIAIGALVSAAQMQSSREVTVLVGAGRDTLTLNAFFPQTVQVRAGDTVTWRINTDELHTVSFTADTPPAELLFAVPVPDADGEFMVNPRFAFPTRMPGAPVEVYSGSDFVSSGFFSNEPAAPDAPPNDTFSLIFETPGVYTYICLIHEEFMTATVVVEAEGTEVPTPEQVLASAEAEIAPLLQGLEAARAASQTARTEPGPGDSTMHFVKAGTLDFITVDPRGEALEFLPQNLTVRAGDTVVWGSSGFHTVSFAPLPPVPEFILPRMQEEGPPLLIINPLAVMPAKPDPVYDPTQYYNSGDIGIFSAGGTSWTLTFEEPGTYEYVCIVHEPLGMTGTITVLPR